MLTLTSTAAPGGASKPYEGDGAPLACGRIDELVFSNLARLNIPPAKPCSDAVFVRRVFLDITGTLPAAHEAREFLLDTKPDKRRALIERLLARDEFADYWAMKWGDLLRIKAEFPINLWPNAAQAYYRWVHTAIKENLSYDQFARKLLTASGSNFRMPQVNFYRAMQNRSPEGIAQMVALTFMGVRAEKWPKEKLAGMAAFFSQVGYKQTGEWKEEIVLFDPGKATNCLVQIALFPDGTTAQLSAERDPREVFADWLITSRNPWFTRSTANRAWAWLMGRGIIHETDNIRPDNPPGNPELLAFLEQELAGAHFDLKHFYRLILNSRTYQLSSIPASPQPESEAYFAQYALRRLEAEVLIDALDQITGANERYSSAIPEPFTYLPDKQRSVALADGSITSPFLEMFGRPPRDTGLESERNNRPTAAQELHLLNSSSVLQKIEQSRMIQYQMQSGKSLREMTANIYLGILSRFPTEEELSVVDAYAQSASAKRREAMVDLAWALINSAEFLYRH